MLWRVESDEKYTEAGTSRPKRSCTSNGKVAIEDMDDSEELILDQQKYPPQHEPGAEEGIL